MPPLAERLRPTTLENYVGQQHIVGQGAVLRKAIENNNLPSFILWGPPGVGKTTLAQIIANTLNRPFYALSAVHAGVKDIRETIEKARGQRFFNTPNPILFIDEIHRFSKSQQDSLLGAVEKGIVTLIGATTENPSFEVIPALLSRCQIYVLKSLEKTELMGMIQHAIETDDVLKQKQIEVTEYEALLTYSGGDGRRLLNTLELLCNQSNEDKILITNAFVTETIQQNIALYDKTGEQHYDIISAFIKSMRGSDPNAAVYYLACMLEGGEDIVFIARRMIIFASEDIGLANPNALLLANTCMQAIQNIGMPESRIVLSQVVVYLATSPKSNSTYLAIDAALAQVRKNGVQPVPLHLRNGVTALMKDLNYGKDYKYAHDHKDHFVELEFMPDSLVGHTFYNPAENPAEMVIKQRLDGFWKGKY
jgi:putative ATPase